MKPQRRLIRETIRGSVPDGKLRHAKIKLASIRQNETPIGGMTSFDRKTKSVLEIATPDSDTSFGVMVRGHETRHASLQKFGRIKPMTGNEAVATQIVDDVIMESTPLPRVSGRSLLEYRRAHLAVAAKDLRAMLQKAKLAKDSIELRNGQLLIAVRVAAMFDHYGDNAVERLDVYKLRKRLQRLMGAKLMGAIGAIVTLAKHPRKRNLAISLLVSLMEEPSPEDMDDMPEGEPHKARDGELVLPPRLGSALEGKMTIRELRPRTTHTARERTIHTRYAPDGVLPNSGRYVNAIVSGDSHGLFARRVRQKAGGTVLIDASGSMGANTRNLSNLCKLIPTATVAYYSGHDGRATGTLSIFAQNGLRYSRELPYETVMGGNAVDLDAIKWMVLQPKPWTLVSDLGFTGGKFGAEIAAHALVERAVKRGDLTVYRSLDAAYEAFGGKGDIDERATLRKARAKRRSDLATKLEEIADLE